MQRAVQEKVMGRHRTMVEVNRQQPEEAVMERAAVKGDGGVGKGKGHGKVPSPKSAPTPMEGGAGKGGTQHGRR